MTNNARASIEGKKSELATLKSDIATLDNQIDTARIERRRLEALASDRNMFNANLGVYAPYYFVPQNGEVEIEAAEVRLRRMRQRASELSNEITQLGAQLNGR
jgi:hypothetical protein